MFYRSTPVRSLPYHRGVNSSWVLIRDKDEEMGIILGVGSPVEYQYSTDNIEVGSTS